MSANSLLSRLGPTLAVFFAIVVVAAGVTGVVLLVAPADTETYFSWTLRPPTAAALIGGFYVASAAVFAWGLTLGRPEARALLAGVLGLAVPTLVLTVIHDEVFDFGRWQALAWAGLFATAPVSATALLVASRREPQAADEHRLPRWCQRTLAAAAVALASVAVLVWLDATRDDVQRLSPVDLIRLTGTYLGAWCSFLAALCGFAALTRQRSAGRVAAIAVAAASGGAGLGLLRLVGDVRHAGASFVALAVLGAGALAVFRAVKAA